MNTAVITGVGCSPSSKISSDKITNFSDISELFTHSNCSAIEDNQNCSWCTSLMSIEETETYKNPRLCSFICLARNSIKESGVNVDENTYLVLVWQKHNLPVGPTNLTTDKYILRKEYLQQNVSAYPRILSSLLKIGGGSIVVDDISSAMEIANLLISQQKTNVVLVGCDTAFFVVEELQSAEKREAKIYCKLPEVENVSADKKAKVVISSVGVVSPLGVGVDANLKALHSGCVGVAKIEKFECDNWAGCVVGQNGAVAYTLEASREALKNTKDLNSKNIDFICCSEQRSVVNKADLSDKLGIEGNVKSLKSGLNAGLQGLEYAKMLLENCKSKQVVVVACDELTKSKMELYSALKYFRSDESEKDFQMKYYSAYRTVFGEGASAFLLETLDETTSSCSNQKYLGEILSCVSTLDGGNYTDANLDNDGLQRAFQKAIKQAGVSVKDVDLISWSPRGTAQDSKIINLRDRFFGKIPMITSVFHTGYSECSSALMSLGCLLESLNQDKGLWRQRFGIVYFDDVVLERSPKIVVALATSHTGGNYVIIVKINKKNI